MKNFILTIFLAVGVSMNPNLEATQNVSEVPATLATSMTSPSFLSTLQDVTLKTIDSDKKLQNVEGLNVEKVRGFVVALCQQGYAELKGTDQECRSICVTAQGAIEDALTKMLNSDEVKSVKAVFLTPLPTTPLRKKGATEELTKIPFESARQYTLDMREITLRALREAGGVIIAAYSEESYEGLKSQKEQGSIQQVKIWEEECKHIRVLDVPLNIKIPGELVGALYLITDKDGNEFYLPTQGIQAKDASEGEAIWKKWLSLSHAETDGVKRSKQMINCIEQHGGEKI